MALGQTAGCPRVNRAKKFMCSPRNTGNINFSLWLTGGLSQRCPDFRKVYVFKVYVPFSCPILTQIERLLPVKPGSQSLKSSIRSFQRFQRFSEVFRIECLIQKGPKSAKSFREALGIISPSELYPGKASPNRSNLSGISRPVVWRSRVLHPGFLWISSFPRFL